MSAPRCNGGGDDVIVVGVIGYNSRTGVWRNKIDGLDIIGEHLASRNVEQCQPLGRTRAGQHLGQFLQ